MFFDRFLPFVPLPPLSSVQLDNKEVVKVNSACQEEETKEIPSFFSIDCPRDQMIKEGVKDGVLTATGQLHPEIALLNINKISDASLTDYMAEQLEARIPLDEGTYCTQGEILVFLAQYAKLKNIPLTEYRAIGDHPLAHLKPPFIQNIFERATETSPHIRKILTPAFLANVGRLPQGENGRIYHPDLKWEEIENLSTNVWAYLGDFYSYLQNLSEEGKAEAIQNSHLTDHEEHKELLDVNKGYVLSGIGTWKLMIANQVEYTKFENSNFHLVVKLDSIFFDDQRKIIKDKLVVYAESQGVCLIEAICQRGLNLLSVRPDVKVDDDLLFDYTRDVMRSSFTRQTKLVTRAVEGFLNYPTTQQDLVHACASKIRYNASKNFQGSPQALSHMAFMIAREIAPALRYVTSQRNLLRSIWIALHTPSLQNVLPANKKNFTSSSLPLAHMCYRWDLPVEFFEIPYNLAGCLALCLRPPLQDSNHSEKAQLVSIEQKPGIQLSFSYEGEKCCFVLPFTFLSWIQTLKVIRFQPLQTEVWDWLLEQALGIIPTAGIKKEKSVLARQPELIMNTSSQFIREQALDCLKYQVPFLDLASTILLFAGYSAGHQELLIPLLAKALPCLLSADQERLRKVAILLLENLKGEVATQKDFPLAFSATNPEDKEQMEHIVDILKFLITSEKKELNVVVFQILKIYPEIVSIPDLFEDVYKILEQAATINPHATLLFIMSVWSQLDSTIKIQLKPLIYPLLTNFAFEGLLNEKQDQQEKELILEKSERKSQNQDLTFSSVEKTKQDQSDLSIQDLINDLEKKEKDDEIEENFEEIGQNRMASLSPLDSCREVLQCIEDLLNKKKIPAALWKLIRSGHPVFSIEEAKTKWIQLALTLIEKANPKIRYDTHPFYRLFSLIPNENGFVDLKRNLALLIIDKSFYPRNSYFLKSVRPHLSELLTPILEQMNPQQVAEQKDGLSSAHKFLILAGIRYMLGHAEAYPDLKNFLSKHMDVILEIMLAVSHDKNFKNEALFIYIVDKCINQDENFKDLETVQAFIQAFLAVSKLYLGTSYSTWLTRLNFPDQIETGGQRRIFYNIWKNSAGILRGDRQSEDIVQRLFKLATLLFDYKTENEEQPKLLKMEDCERLVCLPYVAQNRENHLVYSFIRRLEGDHYTPQNRFTLLMACIRQQIKNGTLDPQMAAQEVIQLKTSRAIHCGDEHVYVLLALFETLITQHPTKEKIEKGLELAQHIRSDHLKLKHRLLFSKQVQLCREYVSNQENSLLTKLEGFTIFSVESHHFQLEVQMELIQAACEEGEMAIATEWLFKFMKKASRHKSEAISQFIQNHLEQLIKAAVPSTDEQQQKWLGKLLTRADLDQWIPKANRQACIQTAFLRLTSTHSIPVIDLAQMLRIYWQDLDQLEEGMLPSLHALLPQLSAQKISELKSFWTKLTCEICTKHAHSLLEFLKRPEVYMRKEWELGDVQNFITILKNSLDQKEETVQEIWKLAFHYTAFTDSLKSLKPYAFLYDWVKKRVDNGQNLDPLEQSVKVLFSSSLTLDETEHALCLSISALCLESTQNFSVSWSIMQSCYETASVEQKKQWQEQLLCLCQSQDQKLKEDIVLTSLKWNLPASVQAKVIAMAEPVHKMINNPRLSLTNLEKFLEITHWKLTPADWTTLFQRAADALPAESGIVSTFISKWRASLPQPTDLKNVCWKHPTTVFWVAYNVFHHGLLEWTKEFGQEAVILPLLMSPNITPKDKEKLQDSLFQFALDNQQIFLLNRIGECILPMELFPDCRTKWGERLFQSGLDQPSPILLSMACQWAMPNTNKGRMNASSFDFSKDSLGLWIAPRLFDSYLSFLEEEEQLAQRFILPLLAAAILQNVIKTPLEVTSVIPLFQWIVTTDPSNEEMTNNLLLVLMMRLAAQKLTTQAVYAFKGGVQLSGETIILLDSVREAMKKLANSPQTAQKTLAFLEKGIIACWMPQKMVEELHYQCLKTVANDLHRQQDAGNAQQRLAICQKIKNCAPELVGKVDLQKKYAEIWLQTYLDILLLNAGSFDQAFEDLKSLFNEGTKLRQLADAKKDSSQIGVTTLCVHIRNGLVEKQIEMLPFYKQKIQIVGNFYRHLQLLLSTNLTDQNWMWTNFASDYPKIKGWVEKFIFSEITTCVEASEQEGQVLDMQIFNWKKELVTICSKAQRFFQGHENDLFAYQLYVTGGKSADQIETDSLYQKSLERLKYFLTQQFPYSAEVYAIIEGRSQKTRESLKKSQKEQVTSLRRSKKRK